VDLFFFFCLWTPFSHSTTEPTMLINYTSSGWDAGLITLNNPGWMGTASWGQTAGMKVRRDSTGRPFRDACEMALEARGRKGVLSRWGNKAVRKLPSPLEPVKSQVKRTVLH
jgi:hypothetical protein